MLAAKHCGVPVRITHSHSSGIMKEDNFINRTYFKVARFLIQRYTTNQLACDVMSGKYLFGDDFRGIVLNNGIDIDKFNPNTSPKLSMHEDLGRTDILKLAAIIHLW